MLAVVRGTYDNPLTRGIWKQNRFTETLHFFSVTVPPFKSGIMLMDANE